jgi:hypothetical protein
MDHGPYGRVAQVSRYQVDYRNHTAASPMHACMYVFMFSYKMALSLVFRDQQNSEHFLPLFVI